MRTSEAGPGRPVRRARGFRGVPWLPAAVVVLDGVQVAGEIIRLNPTVFPTDWTLSNFAAALRQNQLLPALRNSLVVAVSTAVITTVIALPAAYALARYRSRCERCRWPGSWSARCSRSS